MVDVKITGAIPGSLCAQSAQRRLGRAKGSRLARMKTSLTTETSLTTALDGARGRERGARERLRGANDHARVNPSIINALIAMFVSSNLCVCSHFCDVCFRAETRARIPKSAVLQTAACVRERVNAMISAACQRPRVGLCRRRSQTLNKHTHAHTHTHTTHIQHIQRATRLPPSSRAAGVLLCKHFVLLCKHFTRTKAVSV